MIIITGASKGIGQFLFDQFKNDGHFVVGTYFSSAPKCQQIGLSAVDISDYSQVNQWIETLGHELNDIVLLNCAGISDSAFAHKADINEWKRVIDVNLTGTFNVIHCLLPYMRKQKYGRIINFSSVLAKLPTLGVSAYASSKAGLLGLTKSLAAENAALGITVNAINLGYVELGMGIHNVTPEYQVKMKQQIPTGRFCNPLEIYNTVKYLIDTEYVNGSDLDINGGLI